MKQILLLLILFAVNTAFSQTVDPIIYQKLNTRKSLPVIVSFHGEQVITNPEWHKLRKGKYVFSQLDNNAKSQLKVKHFLDRNKVHYRSLKIVNALTLDVNISLLKVLIRFDDIKSIVYDAPIKVLEPVKDNHIIDNEGLELASKMTEDQLAWGVERIEANKVWDLGYEGQNVVVAGQDTGYQWDLNPLKDKYRGYNNGVVNHNYNWHDAIREISEHHKQGSTNPCGLDLKEPCDDNGHGTHTVGTMVGSYEQNLIGVAPKAKWIGCRNMERGWGTLSSYLECFEFFLAPTDLNNENPDVSKAPHVINNSWGCPEKEGCNKDNFYILNEAVQNLKQAGIVVVASAGNSGPNCHTITDPAAIFNSSFTVGSTNKQDSISVFSSRGVVTVDGSLAVKPDVVAPGSKIRSIWKNGNYVNANGTSMAGPHVAGTIALLISAIPKLEGRVDLLEDIVEMSTLKLYTEQNCGNNRSDSPNAVYGHGRINALTAIKRAFDIIDFVSVDEKESSFEILPNPVNLSFTILSDDIVKRVTISNSLGQLVETIDINRSYPVINVGTLSRGLYVVTIENNDGVIRSEKIVKQ